MKTFTHLILCITLLSSGFFLATTAVANNSAAALSMLTFKRLAAVETLLHKNEFSKAQVKLDKLLKRFTKLSRVDQAYTHHMQASIYLHQQQYSAARKYFLLSYNNHDDQKPGLNDKTRLQVVEMLANLAMHEADYLQAIKFSKEYLQQAQVLSKQPPSKTGYLILASAYYQLDDYASAITPLKQVIKQFAPDRSAYSTLFAVYYQLKQLPEATSIVEKMIRLWPDKAEYWLQLASIYLEQDMVAKSLEIMQLAFTQGFLIRPNELYQYIYALYDKNLPHKAASLLATALEKSIINENNKNFRLLATLYVQAKEDKKALASYKKAAQLSTDGKEDLIIAQIYYGHDGYQQSIKHARSALKKGVKLPGNVHMLMAAAYHELADIPATRAHLSKAVKYKETKQTASQWLLSIGDT